MRSIRSVRVVAAVAVLLLGSLSSCSRADDPNLKKLLETFVSELVEITPGVGRFPAQFEMGSTGGAPESQPRHTVSMVGSFSMAKYEVPQNLYEAVLGQNPSRWKGPRNSVEMMSLGEAREFCSRLTGLLREHKLIAADEQIRLPTEAEWEYCCRAGTSTAYSFGDSAQAEGDVSPTATLLGKYAWHTGNAAGNDPPVGALAPNPWGLYDMHGYLWEFCDDAWHKDYTEAPSTSFPAWGTAERMGVIRGGSWKDTFENLRSDSRRMALSTLRDDAVGFRCVKSKVP